MDSPERSEVKTADQLYDDWRGGALRHIVNSIKGLKEEWNDRSASDVMTELVNARENAISEFVHQKRKYNKSFSPGDVGFMELEFPDGSDKKEWLGYVKKVAMRIEQFRSHVLRRNPNPRKPRKPNAREDYRPERTEQEQEWLVAEDILVKHQTKEEKKRMRKEQEGERRKSMPGNGHKKHRARKGGKAPGDMPSHDPRPQGPQHAPRAQIASRAAPAIQPFQWSATRPPPRVAARLPAFPSFPRY